MKKLLMTLLLVFGLMSALYGVTQGTVVLYYNNGTVSYVGPQTFYEFDIQAYIDGGSGSNIFKDGQAYIQYDTTVFHDTTNLNVTVTKMGPMAVSNGELYNTIVGNTFSDAFSITFMATSSIMGLYTSDTYISNSSSSLTTLFRVKMEAVASGSSNLDWPTDPPDTIPNINTLFWEHDGTESGSLYEGISITNATETTAITYSDTGDPALPVRLKNFAAQYIDNKVALTWTTESETQNLGYIIKRAKRYSDDSYSDYEIIASYHENDDLLGAGSTTEQHSYAYYDKNVKPGVTYSYILEDVDYDGNVASHGPVSIVIPEDVLFVNDDFKLSPNYPNPFNPSFTVPLELMKTMDVDISMYDITGKKVMTIVNGSLEPRQYQFRVNASDLNSGIYFVRTIVGHEVITQKMTLLK